jgi:stage II sporulation SpoE-like protein
LEEIRHDLLRPPLTPARAARKRRHPRHRRSRVGPEPRRLAHHALPPRRFVFQAGDQLLLYTDGVTETRDANGAFFPLATWAREQLTTPPRQALNSLHHALLIYSGNNLIDDIAILKTT